MTAKEIWYSWDGHTQKPTNVTGVLYSDGSLLDSKDMDLTWLSSYTYETDWRYIAAYTLGETRERVECSECISGILDFGIGGCNSCKGRGYIWKQG